MKRVLAFHKSRLFSRFGALALDLIIAFVLMVFIIAAIIIPIFDSIPAVSNVEKEYENMMVAFGIYESNDGDISYITSEYDDKLVYFYSTYDDISNYNNLKAESEYFSFDEESGQYIEIGTDEEMVSFYKLALQKANEIVWAREDIRVVAAKVETINKVIVYCGLIISLSITFLIPPLIFKDRSTIGMKPFHLQVVSKTTGDFASRLQILFKFLIFLTFEWILTYFYIGYLIMFISLIMVVITKEKISLTDFLCSTIVVDGMGFNEHTPDKEIISFAIVDRGDEKNG